MVKLAVLRSTCCGKSAKIIKIDRLLVVFAHIKHAQAFNKFKLDFKIDFNTANQMFYCMIDIIKKPLRCGTCH
jgi:hypothetical protein